MGKKLPCRLFVKKVGAASFLCAGRRAGAAGPAAFVNAEYQMPILRKWKLNIDLARPSMNWFGNQKGGLMVGHPQ